MIQKAVIYCRVSDPAQVTKGNALTSQETHCREYATRCKYEVDNVFHEEGITGAIINRPRMLEMLAYLRKHARKQRYIVIIDDINRLARDLKTHIELRAMINEAGGKLESPSVEFGENSDSRLIEHILATVAAHQREKNAEQVCNRMRARLMTGNWVFQAPTGYQYERKSGGGKILVRDEPIASIVQDALENFATGRFESPIEVKRFLELQPVFPKNVNGEVHLQRVIDMLNRQLYTGYVEYPKWGIEKRRGKHEPIISDETYKRIQLRLQGKARTSIRQDTNPDFPLRGFILCDSCERPFTGSWSRGNTKRYAYYFCCNKKCGDMNKSIRREVIEEHFIRILQNISPPKEFSGMTLAALEHCWWQTNEEHRTVIGNLTGEIHRIERRKQQFAERIVDSEAALGRAYEQQIIKLETRSAGLTRELSLLNVGNIDFEGFIDDMRQFLGRPHNLWEQGDIVSRRLVLKLVFSEKLTYHHIKGFKRVPLASPFTLGKRGKVAEKEYADTILAVGKNLLAKKFGLYQPNHLIRAYL